jgi:hypothetical protein
MRSKVERHSEEAEKAVRDVRRATRRQYSAEFPATACDPLSGKSNFV